MRLNPLKTLLCLLLVAGCTNVSRLNELNPPANDFPSALASEYQAYSDSEAEQHHYLTANYYAGKGLRALKGETVEPESPSLPELAAEREQLMKLLTDDVKRVAPQKLARAQLLFDCWQQELSNGVAAEEALCADEFKSTLAEVQDIADFLVYGKETTRAIEFEKGSTHLSEDGIAAIKEITGKLAHAAHYTVILKTYVGKGAAQHKLSDARLNAVRKALVQAGVHEKNIRIKKQGGAKAVILSGDNMPELDAKKVTIVVKTRPKAGE